MDERSSSGVEMEKGDEVILPGFRFHPTDEELVNFYLKRKVQQKPLSIELIRQLDIYKYDPWDLPKLATTGEKEWYFYCPRDRKYRNSTRPNRVTGAGFWKATGTDRPIYSSEGSKCIGLKKSLVFYKGRAAKGVKTDWMMHEFRLPSLADHSSLLKRPLDHKNIPASDAWAICRIFKKTNSAAQRALSHSWVSPQPPAADHLHQPYHHHHHHLFSLPPPPPPPPPSHLHFGPPSTSEIISSMTEAGLQQQNPAISSFPSLDFISYNHKPTPQTCFAFSSTMDVTSMLLNLSAPPPPPASIPHIDFGIDVQQQQQQQQLCNAFGVGDLPLEEKMVSAYGCQWGPARKSSNSSSSSAVDLPAAAAAFGVQMSSVFREEWKPSNNNPSEISTSFSTNKC